MATTEAGPQNVIRGVTGKKKALKQRTNRGYKDFTWMLAWKCYWNLISVLKTGSCENISSLFFWRENLYFIYSWWAVGTCFAVLVVTEPDISDEHSGQFQLLLWQQKTLFSMRHQDFSSRVCRNRTGILLIRRQDICSCLRQQNRIFWRAVRKFSASYVATKFGYFWWEVRKFRAVLVATEPDNSDELSGLFQPVLWWQNSNILTRLKLRVDFCSQSLICCGQDEVFYQ